MGLLFEAVMDKGKTFEEIIKFNPYHDRLGRFTSGVSAAFVTIRTKDPAKQKWADAAIAREKEREAQNGANAKITEAENKIRGILTDKATVNLKGVDPEIAGDIHDSIKQVLDKYPSVKDAFGGFVTDDTSVGTFAERNGVEACYNTATKMIHLNPAYFGDKATFEQKYAASVERGWSPQGTDYKSVVTHEMGHAIDNYVSRRIDGIWGVIGDDSTTARKIWNADIAKFKKQYERATGKVMRENLSAYGTTSPSEWLAEGFAEFMCSAKPRPTAKSIGRRLTNAINKAAEEKGWQ